MPLLTIKDAGRTGKLGIWHITESLDELLKIRSFSAEDLKALDGFTYEHRKKEWLVARILAEKLSGEKNVQIVYDKYSKPSLKGSSFYISLSHSHDLLTVILDKQETGIDIELVKPKVVSIKNKFMSTQELEAADKGHEMEQLTLYWCAKEALYKLYGKKELTFKENLIVEPFKHAEKGLIKGWIRNKAVNKCFTLQFEKINSGNETYQMAYVCN